MAPQIDPEDPYADAPAYPEDAEWFVFDGKPPSVRLDQIAERIGEDADEEDVRDALPPWAEIQTGGVARDSVTFPSDSPVPPIAVDDYTWKMRASQGQIIPLDADGHRLPSFRDPDPLVEEAKGWLDGLAAAPDAAVDANSADSADGSADADGPLADVTIDDLADMDYSELRALASATEGVDGNASRAEIEDALTARLEGSA